MLRRISLSNLDTRVMLCPMTRYIALFATVLLGCSGPTEYEIQIDPDYDRAEMEQIVWAARRWESVSEGAIRLKILTSYPTFECGTISVRNIEPRPGTDGHTLSKKLPWCYHAEIRSKLDRHVLLHEFGHAFDLDHSDDPADVMHVPVLVEDLSEGDAKAISG